MHSLFIQIYSRLINSGKKFWIVLLLAVIGIISVIKNLHIEEDVSALIPMDKRISELSNTFSNSHFADQILINIYQADTTVNNPDALMSVADSLLQYFSGDSTLVKQIRTSVDDEALGGVYNFFSRNLPIYLTDDDYNYLDTIVTLENLNNLMRKNYQSIIAPTGFGTAKYILKDPFSLVPRCLQRLRNFQLDDGFTIYKSHIFTKDKKHLLCFIDPANSSKNTKVNRGLINKIENFEENCVPDGVVIEYYGGTVVAVANANRVSKDIYITITAALVLMLLFFVFVFRSFRILFVLFTPVVLGVGISLVVMWMLYPSLSAISLGIGAILVGISIDFSLHYYSHVKFGHKPIQILKAITEPVIMSSLTTASAFFCLYVVKSQALNQLGLFAGFSVMITSVLILIILPLALKNKTNTNDSKHVENGIYERLALYNLHKNKYWILAVFILSVICFVTGKQVKFNADIATLNYMPQKLQDAENHIKAISAEAASAIYIVASDSSLDKAISHFEDKRELFSQLKSSGIVENFITPADLILSQKEQTKQIERWNSFWQKKGRDSVIDNISGAGIANHFKKDAFNGFYQLLSDTIMPVNKKDENFIKDLFLSNQIQQKNGVCSVVSVCKVDQANKIAFFSRLKDSNDLLILDKQFFTNQFFEVLKEDFNKLINASMLVVFLIVLLFFGRIESTVITFIPILLSWNLTIGLMGIFDIHFNIFNIIICTFIFGLGIDYSIFLTRGLINRNKYGTGSIIPYKVSILLSVTTTLIGVGVLIFAQHPAIKSIALVTIIGIISVVLITFTVIPLLFQLMFYNKGQKRVYPVVAKDIFVSLMTFAIFLVGVVILSAIVLVFRITPFFKVTKKKIIHYLVYLTCKLIVKVNVLIKKDYVDKFKFDLSKPAVIVCNHQSHLDIALILAFSPKIIVLTNEWVWKNPFYGFIIRYIDYYPIYTGIHQGYEKIAAKVKQGYSVLIFPEGTRTKDGGIARFHQGAFSLADYLGLDLQPVLLHGAYECMPKTEFFLRSGHITLQFFDRVKVDKVNLDEGITYRPQAKRITAFYRQQYELLKQEREDVDFFAHRLINQYVFKGPVLEWYMRVKLKIEKYYRFYDEHLPKEGKIIDVGCGYGFMLNLLSFIRPQQKLVGWDYDQEKINIAVEVGKLTGVSFQFKDVVPDEFELADVFVFNDVLHYFNEEKQQLVLNKAYAMLNEGGQIFIRDADTDLKKRTKVTKWTEWWSIRVLKFNKMKYEVDFMSSSRIEAFAKQKNMKLERIDNAKYTSNLTHILSKTKSDR